MRSIQSEWGRLNGKVEEVTAKLRQQGGSLAPVKDFSAMYSSGYDKYVKRMMEGMATPENGIKWLGSALKSSNYTSDTLNEMREVEGSLKRIRQQKIDGLITQDTIADLEKANAQLKELQSPDKKLASNAQISNLKDQISSYIHTYTGMGKGFRTQFEDLGKGLSLGVTTKGDLKEAVVGFNELKDSVRDAGVETKSFWTKVGELVDHSNAQLAGMYLGWQDFINIAKQATEIVIQLDTALTELRKVSDAPADRLAKSFDTSARTAQELGNTIDSVINQTADWARTGYSIDEAEKLARATTLFQTVGDNMTTESASSAMISTLKGFEMGADHAIDIVDKYNIVANNFSSDTAGLAAAVERAGAALNAAGNTYAESLGLIVAANSSIQNPESVGQMLKTFSMRLRGASAADLEALGIDTTGMSQGRKSIVQQFKAMAGIDIMEGTDYKSTFQILDELHEKWSALSDAEQAALSESVGGKRGGSVMASHMQNWEDAKAAMEMANNSAGK